MANPVPAASERPQVAFQELRESEAGPGIATLLKPLTAAEQADAEHQAWKKSPAYGVYIDGVIKANSEPCYRDKNSVACTTLRLFISKHPTRKDELLKIWNERSQESCGKGNESFCFAKAYSHAMAKEFQQAYDEFIKLCETDYAQSCLMAVQSLNHTKTDKAQKTLLIARACALGISGCEAGLRLAAKGDDKKLFETKIQEACEKSTDDRRVHNSCQALAMSWYHDGKTENAISVLKTSCERSFPSCRMRATLIRAKGDSKLALSSLRAACVKFPVEFPNLFPADQADCDEALSSKSPSSEVWREGVRQLRQPASLFNN